jgi:hypothetical protein
MDPPASNEERMSIKRQLLEELPVSTERQRVKRQPPVGLPFPDSERQVCCIVSNDT